jgi:hypothetical protein
MLSALRRFWILSLFIAFGVNAQAAHNAVIKWGASPDAGANPSLGYNVYKLATTCPASGTAGFSKVNSAPISALTFTDSPLAVGSVCYYVTATLNGTESVPSNTAGGTVTPATVSITITIS